MTSISETSLSLLTSNSTSTPWGILLSVVAAAGLYYASPTRLTHVLVAALADVENAYLAGVENGVVLSADADIDIAGRLAILQIEVSILHAISLRSSLSPLSTLYDAFNISRSVAVFRCLRDVRRLGTYIEISNESQRRELASASESRCQCRLANRSHIFLRRRDSPTRVCV